MIFGFHVVFSFPLYLFGPISQMLDRNSQVVRSGCIQCVRRLEFVAPLIVHMTVCCLANVISV